MYDKLSRRAHTDHHSKRLSPGWLKYLLATRSKKVKKTNEEENKDPTFRKAFNELARTM